MLKRSPKRGASILNHSRAGNESGKSRSRCAAAMLVGSDKRCETGVRKVMILEFGCECQG